MDFENLLSVVMESKYTPMILWNIFSKGSNLIYLYLKKKIQNQSNQ